MVERIEFLIKVTSDAIESVLYCVVGMNESRPNVVNVVSREWNRTHSLCYTNS